ncbi:MAG: nitroreductase [Acidimicrobiales bacterium]
MASDHKPARGELAVDLSDALRRRRMVRAFSPEPLDPGMLDQLLDLARRAPSAGNTQGASFLVLDSSDAVGQYWDITLPEPRRTSFRWQQLLAAPALVVITVDPSSYVERYAETDKRHPRLGQSQDEWSVPYWWVDAGAIAQNLLLLAVDAGLGACLFGLFEHEAAVKTSFGVPDEQRLVATVALGRPLPDEPGRSASRQRPDVAAVIHRDGWT